MYSLSWTSNTGAYNQDKSIYFDYRHLMRIIWAMIYINSPIFNFAERGKYPRCSCHISPFFLILCIKNCSPLHVQSRNSQVHMNCSGCALPFSMLRRKNISALHGCQNCLVQTGWGKNENIFRRRKYMCYDTEVVSLSLLILCYLVLARSWALPVIFCTRCDIRKTNNLVISHRFNLSECG